MIAGALAGCVSAGAAAQVHLLGPEQLQAAFRAQQARRERCVASLERLLNASAAGELARGLGLRLPALERALAVLDDAEVEELAGRAQALSADPVAGQSQTPPPVNTNPLRALAVVGLVLAVLVLLLVSSGVD